MIKKLLCWFVLAFAVISCDESFVTPDSVARGLNYYPLAVGNYRVYDVTDIQYQNNVPTKTRFQMREWVADSFMNQTNTLVYKIIRSVRPDAQSIWEDDSVMVVTKDHNRVILTKHNTKFIKMVFPVTEGKTWEADAYNDRYLDQDATKREIYTYSSVDAPYQLADLTYDSTLIITVLPPESSYPGLKDNRKEVYARNIGMIHRVFDRKFYSDCVPSNCPLGPNYILDGHERQEVLIEHGKL